jgi:nicotinate-nucleotide pyrophosphorylase (carboxylating)
MLGKKPSNNSKSPIYKFMTVPLKIVDISSFLNEDIGSGDITATIFPEAAHAQAEVITREDMVLCGQAWFDAVFKHLDANVNIIWLVTEGEVVKKNTTLCQLSGLARGLLTGERTALNLLQLLSATATLSREYAYAVAGTGCKVLDTRKTIPGLRNAQKYAVACGGCYNHRIGLYDGVLIKENHIMAAGSITKAIQAARKLTKVTVEVEVESMTELVEALAAKPDRIMLDNFSLEDLHEAVKLNAGAIDLEASGNIDLDNIRTIAETGVDFISIGALTKNIKAVDLSMRIKLVN